MVELTQVLSYSELANAFMDSDCKHFCELTRRNFELEYFCTTACKTILKCLNLKKRRRAFYQHFILQRGRVKELRLLEIFEPF